MKEQVVLVDEQGRDLGVCEKLQAHREGRLHRAFSIFIFGRDGRLLLQRRALNKYHSGGLWSNTCCSHPRPGEEVLEAAHRRLKEEMGMACPLREAFSFTYRHAFEGGLTEHEFDHVLVGESDADPIPDPAEAVEWKRVEPKDLLKDVARRPEVYSVWFRLVVERVIRERQANA